MMNQITPDQPGETGVPRELTALISEWQYELSQRVDAQELSADTAKGYERGATKFLTWLNGTPSPDAIRTWKAVLLKAGTRPASINA